MAEYDESEYFTDSPEEIAEREREEALRRMVRTEIRRIHTGAADEDIAEDIRREEEAETAAEKQQQRAKWIVWLSHAMTGDVLILREAERIYKIIGALGVIFFVSIATTFAALHSDLRCSRLEKEVALLHEKAIRMREARHESDSHTAIVRQLSKRGIEMIDPHSQPRIIEN